MKRQAVFVRIAFVHDYLNQYGGAERVLEALHDIAPTAPVYTSIYAAEVMPSAYATWDIRPSWMQYLPAWRTFFRHYFMLYPMAFGACDLHDYDLVISSSSAYAKGVRVRPGAVHICYCHTPMRFVWQTDAYVARERIQGVTQHMMRFLLQFLRRWDVANSAGVTHFIANSHVVAERIHTFYGREATIIPPPVDLAPVNTQPPGDYLLTGGRLVPYKRIDLAIQACSALNLPLVVFGDGRDKDALMRLAGPSVRFVGRVSDAQRQELFNGCRAFLFPGEEDFGITPLEAMAAGRPVVAYRAGGALDTVKEGQTGIFFDQQTPEALMTALHALMRHSWDAHDIRTHAEYFGRAQFDQRMRAFIRHATGEVTP